MPALPRDVTAGAIDHMPELHRIVREVSWHNLFPWLMLFRTCRLAAELRKLLLAAAGIVCTGLGWWLIATVVLSEPDRIDYGANLQGAAAPPRVYAPLDAVIHIPWNETERAFTANWQWATHPVRVLFGRDFTFGRFLVAVLSGLWAIAVWSLFGGAICRLAAVQLAMDQRLTLASAFFFTIRKWVSHFAAPLMPLGMVSLLLIPMIVAGVVLHADLGVLAAAIVWPLVLVLGVLVMMLVAGLALGFPLMWASVSTDGSDSFDAVSRSYTYVGQRPLHYLFYLLVALTVGIVGWLIINTLAALAIYLTSWGVSWGSGEARWRQIEYTPTSNWFHTPYLPPIAMEPTTPEGPIPEEPLGEVGRFGATLIAFWTGCVRLLALSYAYSFFWTAATGMYLLLRRDADAVEIDEVLLEGDDDPSGLPAVQPDAAGVPVMADPPDKPPTA